MDKKQIDNYRTFPMGNKSQRQKKSLEGEAKSNG